MGERMVMRTRDIVVRAASLIDRTFQDRELFLRAGGRVHFVTLSRRRQMSGVAFLALATAWSLYLTTIYYVQHAGSAGSGLLVSSTRMSFERMATDPDGLHVLVDDAKREIASLGQKADAGSAELDPLRGRITAMTEALDKLIRERAALSKHAQELETQIASLQADRGPLVAQLSERAVRRTRELERVIALTGVDVNELLKAVAKKSSDGGTSASGTGGLFVAYRANDAEAVNDQALHASEAERIAAVFETQEERYERLRKIMAHLPLASPLDDYEMRSGFGKRIDPINGRLAMHPGVDLVSVPHAPVYSTAPGKVVFAGWYGGYGKMVEIDHGLGLHTRYAHLRSIAVQAGQRIAEHTRVGIMGSTGRSVGAHVHYEVLVAGRAYNPAKFLEVGKYALAKE